MKVKYKPTALIQYILIYLTLIIPGSSLFAKYLQGDFKYYIIFILCFVLFVLKRKYRKKGDQYPLYLSLFLLVATLFVRTITGGVGIESWMQLAVCLLIVQFAICCDKDMFFARWIRLVAIFAIVSIVFWSVFTILPQLVDVWPAEEYATQSIGTGRWATDYHGKGLLLYSYMEIHSFRNCGIYTEPGVYQIVLNSALFLLLFWNDKLHIRKKKEYKLLLLVIIVAIVTCQSTTGYIGFLINVVAFMFYKTDKSNIYSRVRMYLLIVAAVGILALLYDYSINGTNSILYNQVMYKLFDTSGSLDITNGSGQYRLGTILLSLNSIVKHPLGVGYDTFNSMKNMAGEGYVAASFVSFAAVYGIIPWLVSIGSLFSFVIKRQKTIVSVVYILLFINTTLAQTDIFYPALTMIPIYLSMDKSR